MKSFATVCATKNQISIALILHYQTSTKQTVNVSALQRLAIQALILSLTLLNAAAHVCKIQLHSA